MFYFAVPQSFYTELNSRFFLRSVLDLSPGPGNYGQVCIEEGTAYTAIAMSERHASDRRA